jgi:hypothetical protein
MHSKKQNRNYNNRKEYIRILTTQKRKKPKCNKNAE